MSATWSAPEEIADGIRRVRRPFEVCGPAQAAAIASLAGIDEIARRKQQNSSSVATLRDQLAHVGFPTPVTDANFVYLELGGIAQDAMRALATEGVFVRHLSAFGAANALRITAGLAHENAAVAAALERFFSPRSRES